MSKMDNILKKLQDVLSEEDVKSFQTDVLTLIEEKVSIKVDTEKEKVEQLAEKYCDMKIQEGIKKIAEKLIIEYDGKLDQLETTLVEKLDKFLDLEITSKISNDTLKQIAVNETYGPIIDGIQSLFEHQHVALDSDGYASLRKYQDKIGELHDQLAESIADKIELEESVEVAATKLLIAKQTDHLTESEKSKVFEFFDGKSLTETQSKIENFIELITDKAEAVTIKENSSTSVISEGVAGAISDDNYIAEEQTINVKDKDKELEEGINSQYDLLNAANRFI
jgi:hypothetical protein